LISFHHISFVVIFGSILRQKRIPFAEISGATFEQTCDLNKALAPQSNDLVLSTSSSSSSSTSSSTSSTVTWQYPAPVTPFDQCRQWLTQFRLLRAPGISPAFTDFTLPPAGSAGSAASSSNSNMMLLDSLVEFPAADSGNHKSSAVGSFLSLASALYQSGLDGQRRNNESSSSSPSSPSASSSPASAASSSTNTLALLHLNLSREFSNFISNEAHSTLQLLEAGQKLQRSLKLLDTNPRYAQLHCLCLHCLFDHQKKILRLFSRECHKIGVIYVAPDQDDQKMILRNERGSAEYEAFVDALGWPVRLKVEIMIVGLSFRNTF
jgi:hypothetical protein